MNIGEALIEILADAGKFTKDATSKLTNPLRTIGKTASAAFSTTFHVGMAAAATLATAAITKTINGGLTRLEGIDTAKARLRGIGVVGEELEKVMDQVRDSVRGTSITLNGAAQAAALMMTSGVEAGKPLEATLDALTNAAAATGREIEEITPLWQEMAVAGEVTSGVVRRLGDFGVNALAAIADEFGVTQQEADKLVKDGKVSFEDFNKAVSNQMGAMAASIGNSFKGMKDNTNAAFSMIGAAGLEPLKDAFVTVMPHILGFMYDLSDVIAESAKGMSKTLIPAAERLGEAFKNLDAGEVFKSLGDGIEKFKGLIAPVAGLVLGSFGPLLANIPVLGQLFSKLTGPVGLFIGLVIEMFRNSDILRESIGKLFSMFSDSASALSPLLAVLGDTISLLGGTIGDMLGRVIEAVIPIIQRMAEIMGPVFTRVLSTLQPLIQKLGGAIGDVLVSAVEKLLPPLLDLVEALLPVYLALMEVLVDVLGNVIDALLPVAETLIDWLAPALEWVAEAVEFLVDWLTNLFTSTEEGASIWQEAWQWIQDVVGAVVDWFNEYVAPLFEAVWEKIKDVAQSVATWYDGTLAPLFEAVGGFLGAVFERVEAVAKATWEGIKIYWDLLKSYWESVWDAIQWVWDKIGPPLMRTIEAVIENLKITWDHVWNTVKTIFQIVWDSIRTIVDIAINSVKNIINTVTALIKGDWQGVWDGMKSYFTDIWGGILDGLSKALDRIVDWIKGLKDTIVRFFSNAGRWLVDAGKSIITGLWDGMKSIWSNVTGWLGGLGDIIANVKGPEQYDRQLLIPAGTWIMEGLEEGARAGWRDVEKFFKGVGPAIDINPQRVDYPEPVLAAAAGSAPSGEPGGFTDGQVEVLARAIFEAVRSGFGNGVSSFFDANDMGV